MRQTAKDKADKFSSDGPAYFGLKDRGDEYDMVFTNDLGQLDKYAGMQMAIVAPDDIETFDMISPKDYGKKLSLKDEKSVRKYLSNLLDCL